MSGFLVFLIALPLCLAIAKASGFPPIAGVFTAIVGGLVTPFFSNSELTIKGPAAGLIVIVLGCVYDFGFSDGADAAADFKAYRIALGIAVAAGVLQMLLGLLRAGVLAEFFPSAAVHGLLAAIGVIIIAKQVPIALGVGNKGEPLELLARIPEEFRQMNPQIALIGGVSLLVLFLLPFIKHPALRRIPGPMLVLLVAVPLGMWFDLDHAHTYSLLGHSYSIDPTYLVDVPSKVLGATVAPDAALPRFSELLTGSGWGTLAACFLPDFAALATVNGWKWVVLFTLIGSLESLLSAKAIDLLDPAKRKTNFNRDLLAVGLANTLVSCIGGLPMISEIVRSRANIDNGGRTRWANAFHGLFLLAAILLLPSLIHRIPLAALAAMLVYTGFRLASPKEFLHVHHIGREQLVVFVTTLVAVLATDLLEGIAIGILTEVFIHYLNGVPVRSLLKPYVDIEPDGDDTYLVRARYSAVFTNWILFKRRIHHYGIRERKNIVVDLSETHLVDHTVMAKLHDLQRDFEAAGLRLDVVGLDGHVAFSNHPYAGRRKNPSQGSNQLDAAAAH
jgi:MFS superfamily sulfate permease-like transporter